MPTQQQFDAFKQLAISQGHDPAEVDAFISTAGAFTGAKEQEKKSKIGETADLIKRTGLSFEDAVSQLGLDSETRQEVAKILLPGSTSDVSFGTEETTLQDKVTERKALGEVDTQLAIDKKKQMDLLFPNEDDDVTKDEKLENSLQIGIRQLERLYGKGNSSSVGSKEDLSLGGESAGGFERFGLKVRQKLGAFDAKTLEDFKIYENQLAFIPGLLTQRFGSGTPQEAEGMRLLRSAPSLSSTDKEAKAWFENMRELLGFDPENDLESKKTTEELPKKTKDVSFMSTEEKQFEQGIRDMYGVEPEEFYEYNRQMGEAMMMSQLVSAQDVKNLTSFVRNIFSPKKSGAAMREGAIAIADDAGKTIDGDKIIEKVAKWGEDAKRVQPDANSIKRIDSLVKGSEQVYAGKKVPASQAFSDWLGAKTGFTASGKTGNSLRSGYHLTIRDALRPLIDEVAPGFDKGTKLIAKGYETSKTLNRFLFPATVGTAAAAGTSAILGGFKNLFGD